MDIATAREEFYPYPGSLPDVSPSNLTKDLARRDFSINALALRIYPEPSELLDPFAGLADLQNKRLRILHPLSFIEDPTRIIRGARLAARLGFDFAEETRALLGTALKPGTLKGISKARLRAELELSLSEIHVYPVLQQLEQSGALKAMFGLKLKKRLLESLDQLRSRQEIPDESYLLALFMSLGKRQLETLLETYNWPRRYAEASLRLKDIVRQKQLSGEQLKRASEAEKAVIKALSPKLAQRLQELENNHKRPSLSGKDVLDLGLLPGPAVGRILAEVAKERDAGRLINFEDELEFARHLVRLERREQA
jgi:tRNA nucleotidyltransferase (CCA-adding enzyme)